MALDTWLFGNTTTVLSTDSNVSLNFHILVGSEGNFLLAKRKCFAKLSNKLGETVTAKTVG